MSLTRMAHVSPPIVEPAATVLEAVNAMARGRVGAVLVMEQEVLRGIFTERDVMLRVVLQGRDAAGTSVRDVMTSEVKTLTEDASPDEAIDVMLLGHLRHVPILDRDGRLRGLLSIRALLEDKVHDLSQEVSSLEQYIANDGPGG